MPQLPGPIERRVIRRIAIRACMAPLAIKLDRRALEDELALAHANGCPLRLDALLRAHDLSFFTDVLGIHRDVDRATGVLRGAWRPRYMARAAQRKAA